MLGIFDTIYKPNRQHDPNKVLENKFTLEEISQLFTVRRQTGNFEVYPGYSDFFKKLDDIAEEDRQYHEVIFEQSQKIKFDIDASLGSLIEFKPSQELAEGEIGTPEQKFWHILDIIIDAIKTAFFLAYSLEVGKMILCTSIGPVDGVLKYSAHLIICNYYVTGSAQAQEFTVRTLEYIPNTYRRFLDTGVNKRVQNFRIIGCHKGDGRTKVIARVIDDESGENVDCNGAAKNTDLTSLRTPREETLITHIYGLKELPDLVTSAPVKRFNTQMCTGDIDKVLQICSENGILRDNRFNCARGGMFLFTRLRPSHCELCERTHDSDNTVIVNVAPGPADTIYVYKGCRKYKQERGGLGVRIGTFTSEIAGGIGGVNNDPAGTMITSYSEREISHAVINPLDLYPRNTLFDDLPIGSRNVYDEPALKPFELADTLVVHAAMKMGKTKALRQYVDKYFASKVRRDIIRYISFRQTFSGNVKEKFGDFTLYSEAKGPLAQDRLIIQVESLHRLDIGIEPPDLLILDECESIFEQFDSGLLRSFGESFAKFQYLLKYSKHVICMDAYISDRTYRILANIRGVKGLQYHRNVRKNACDDKYYITGDCGKWFGLLYKSMADGERIAIQISSLTEARAITEGIKRKYPEKVIKLYSSETLQSEKREHFANVNLYWQQCDVLMYTPTVSAGVSFELKHFDRCYGYFTDQSCPVETCMQMIGRIRDVASKTYYVFLNATGAALPVDIDNIRNGVYQRRENLAKTFDETGLRVEYGPDGAVKYHSGDYFTIWLENTRIRNLSRNAFIRRFIYMVSLAGAKTYHATDAWFAAVCGATAEQMKTLITEHSETKGDINDKICTEIANARDIDEDCADTIRANMRAQVDVPIESVRAYEKFRLRSDYNYVGEIDKEFVRTYRVPKVRRMYRNLIRIRCDPDPQRAIAKIQAEELAVYNHSMQDGLAETTDIHRRYVFDQHRYAIGLLQLCGWKDLEDRAYQHTIMLAERMRQSERLYWDTIEAACREFQIKVPSKIDARVHRNNDAMFVTVMIAPISKILDIMYGVKITVRQKDPDMYFLQSRDLFTLNPGVTSKPLLRLPEFVGDE